VKQSQQLIQKGVPKMDTQQAHSVDNPMLPLPLTMASESRAA